ncbi:MAG: tail fiber domain-containing protein, partial [Bacteroidota bacterium]
TGDTVNFGNPTKDFWTFDPAQPPSAQWAELTNVPAGFVAREGAVAFTIANKAYIGTGNSSSGRLKDFWVFDPAQPLGAQWAALPALPAAFVAREDAVVFTIGNKAYIGTGRAGSVVLKDFWEFDPAQPAGLQWTALPNLPDAFQARFGAVAFTINTVGYVGTGQFNTNNDYLADFWQFDSVVKEFVQVINVDGSANWLNLQSVNQDLSLLGNTLRLTGDTSTVNLSSYAQDLSLANNVLSLSNDPTTVNLSNYAQDLSLANSVLSLSNDPTTVDLSSYHQDLSLANNLLSLSNDSTPVDLTNYFNNWQVGNGNAYRLTGNVGIGISNPTAKLQLAGDLRMNGTDLFLRGGTDGNHGLGWYGPSKLFNNFSVDGPVLYGFSGGALGSNQNGSENIALRWTPIGRVGIGVTTPSKGRLEVAGNSGSVQITYAFLANASPATGRVLTPVQREFSIYASGRMGASEFFAFSDARIKNILGQSNSEADLATLLAIEITDYQHIDTIQNGRQVHKKVIAQQVAEVFPQAVSSHTREVIPDIYQRASLQQGWIELTTDLGVGDRVKIITENSNELHPVTAVEQGRFQVADLASERKETVFVYGREVDDFHTVDYEAIAMLNVSATQALADQIGGQQKIIESQQEIIELQQQKMEAFEQEITRLQALENRFAALEALLKKPAAPSSAAETSTTR